MSVPVPQIQMGLDYNAKMLGWKREGRREQSSWQQPSTPRTLATARSEGTHSSPMSHCGPRALGPARDARHSLKMGCSITSTRKPTHCNSSWCLQICSSFIWVRDHLFASNKLRLATASFQHMACLCPVPVHLSRPCG